MFVAIQKKFMDVNANSIIRILRCYSAIFKKYIPQNA